MFVRPAALALLGILLASTSFGQALSDKRETFGAVVAPAALPSGSTAAYGFVGAPEVGAGYRQGIEGLELEARASLDYFAVALTAEVGARLPVLRGGELELAPTLGLGLVYDSGARYFDLANFQFLGIRPRVGVIASMRLVDTVRGIASLELPWAFSLAPPGGSRVTPLVGAGAEVFLSPEVSALVLGQIGLDAIKEPLGVTQWRTGYRLTLGIGYRLF